jgi:hypothetical protein
VDAVYRDRAVLPRLACALRGNDAIIELEAPLNEGSTPEAGGDWPRIIETLGVPATR